MKNAPLNLQIVLGMLLALALSACAISKDQVLSTPKQQAVSFIRYEGSINGKPISGYRRTCMFSVHQDDASQAPKVAYDAARSMIVIQSEPGTIKLDQLTCLESKVFYNRTRYHTLSKPLTFKVEAGRVSYAGDIVFDYTPSTFSPGDLLFTGAGGTTNEDYRLSIKLTDAYPAAQKFFLETYGDMPKGFTFKKNLLDPNPLVSR